MYLTTIVRILNAPLHPFDYSAAVAEIAAAVGQYQQASQPARWISPDPRGAGPSGRRPPAWRADAEARIGRVPGDAALRRQLNGVLRRVARLLVPLNYARGERFDHDPALKFGTVPRLEAALGLPSASGELKPFLKVGLVRESNKVRGDPARCAPRAEAVDGSSATLRTGHPSNRAHMNNLLGDLRYGARMLGKRPGLSALAIVALAVGVGLTTTMFSIVYAMVLKGLPYDRSDRLAAIFRDRPAQGIQFLPVGIHDFTDWREQQKSFDAIAAFYAETVNVSGSEGQPVRYLGAYASANLFDILRVRPMLGRTFRPEEDKPSTPPVMILSYRAWQDRFRGDPQVIGRSVRTNSEMTTIVGVMPQKFDFPGQMDAWLPLRIDPLAFPRGSGPALEGTQLQAVARLKDGVSFETAQTEMSLIARRIAADHPESNDGIGVMVMRQTDLFIGPQGRSMLLTMLGAVFGVLLIACANVANLLLARTALRTKEIAIRTALGAGRLRTIFQLLAETLVLAVAGTAAGLLVAKVGIDFFNASTASQELPLWLVVGFDPAVIAFVLALTVLSAILAGTIPALRASKGDVSEILNDEARGSSGLRLGRISKVLVVGQLAFSCGLLVAAGLMIRTIVNVARFDYGYNTANVYTARLGLFAKDYPTPLAQRQFYDRVRLQVGNLPGVRTAAYTSDLPSRGFSQMQRLSVDGVAYPAESDHPRARRVVITPGYFDLFDVKPTAGRVFTDADQAGSLPSRSSTSGSSGDLLAGTIPSADASSSGRTPSHGGRSSASCPTCTSAAPSAGWMHRTKACICPSTRT